MKKCVIAVLGIVILLCACGQNAPTWQEQYDLGVRYLSEGNYEEAIIAFAAAIEIDPKQPDSYIGLADAYIGTGDYDMAIETIAQGREACGDMEGFDRVLNNIAFLQNNETGIRITSFYFDKAAYLAGDETDFLVSVAYKCPEGEDCILMIGANTREPYSFAMMDKDHQVTGSGGYQFRVSVAPVQWEESYFGIYVNLSEADHAETWTPFASDKLYIDREGNVSGYNDTNLYAPDQSGVLVANVDNPLMLDEINFLGHSIENLDIETARSLMTQNFPYVSESGFDDNSETWWISGSNQQFGFGPDIDAMQYKTEDYVCLWSINTALHYSDREQLHVVRDIYTYDTLSEVLVKLGVTNGVEVADYIKGLLGKEYTSFEELWKKTDLIQWPWVDGVSISISPGGGPVTDSGGFISTTVEIHINYWGETSSLYSVTFCFGQNSYAEYMYQFVDYLDSVSVWVDRR